MAKISFLWIAAVLMGPLHGGEDGNAYFEKKLKESQIAGDASGEKQWIEDLTDYVVWNDELAYDSYFNNLFKKLKADGSPKAIESVERFMNFAADRENRQASAFHEAASECWFELKGRRGGDREKLSAALGCLEPSAKDRPLAKHFCDVLRKAGPSVRNKIYEKLLDPEDNNTDRDGYLAGLMAYPDFLPTDAEIERIIRTAGLSGRNAAMIYLGKLSDARAIPLILAAFKHSDRYQVLTGVYLLENYRRSQASLREPLVQGACDLFDSVTDEKWGEHAYYLRWSILAELFDMGSPPRAKQSATKFLENYKPLGKDDAALSWAKRIIEAK